MLSLSLPNIFVGLILFCTFLQISQRRLSPMLKLSQFSSFSLSAFVFLQAFIQKEWPLYGFGCLFLLLQVFVLPQALERKFIQLNGLAKAKQAIPAVWSVFVGLLCVCAAVLLCVSKIITALPSGGGIIAISFAVTLLGVWLVIVQTKTIAQMIGVLTLENGLVLAVVNRFSQGWVIIVLAVLLSIFAGLILVASSRYVEDKKTIAARVGG